MKLTSFLTHAVAAAAMSLAAGAASADTFQYVLTTPDEVASWQLESPSTPSGFDSNSFYFTNVEVSSDTYATAFYDISFYNALAGGGLTVWDLSTRVIVLVGDVLYTNATDPLSGGLATLKTGTYTFGASTLSVTAVPEPETYAMLLAGLGVVGAVARRRRDKAAA